MITAVIPDIHQQIDRLEAVLKHAGSVDHTVFLGDFADSFDRTEDNTRQMINWLVENTPNPKYTFLYGNHDLPYAYPGIPELSCSGHSFQTHRMLENHSDIWKRFKLHTWVDGWLLTHAGLNSFIATTETVDKVLDKALDYLVAGIAAAPVRAGEARGGNQKVGGVTWLDFNDEFEPIEELKQIFGHTRGKTVRKNGDNYCIDCDLNYYAIIEDGEVTIKEFGY